MALSGTRSTASGEWLNDRERRVRSVLLQRQAHDDGLTPDLVLIELASRARCLPSAGLRVAVVGAGFAGLMAGWYLSRCGVDVTVYEADSRVGGRVQTDHEFIAQRYVEAGAELIGENHPLWNLYAARFGLTLTGVSDYPYSRLRLRGRDLPIAEQALMNHDVKGLQRAIGAVAVGVDRVQPWLHPRAREWDRMSVADAFRDPRGLKQFVTQRAHDWMEFTLGNDNCAPIAAQSYLGLLGAVSGARLGVGDDADGMMGYWLSTETHRCQGGNDQLGTRFAEHLLARRQLQLNTMVTTIAVQPGTTRPVAVEVERNPVAGAAASAGPGGARFDYVVLATPPTVWSDMTVTPALPPGIALTQGPAVKFITRYCDRFWLLPDQAPYEGMPMARWDRMGSLWEGSDNQANATLADQSVSHPVALSVFAGGAFIQADGEAYRRRVAELYPRGRPGPGKGATAERWLNWPHRPFIRTGYGVPTTGQASTVFSAQQVPHGGRVFLAGEQTSSGFFGYMEGALQSGARAARDILRIALVPCARLARDRADSRAPQVATAPGGSGYAGGGGRSGGGGSTDAF